MPILSNYYPLQRGIELLKESNINSLVCISKPGLGKSYSVDKVLTEANISHTVFKGAISEARFWEFIQENNEPGKIIVLRDCGNLLRHLTFVDFLKSATDIIPVRSIKRQNYSNHSGVSDTIEFQGKILWEINTIPKKNTEDLDAVFDRSMVIELNFSLDEIKAIMFQICQNDAEREVTNYLIENISKINPNSFNLRTQAKMFQIYQNCITKSLNWKSEMDNFIQTEQAESRKIIYRLVGNGTIKRMELVKFLMRANEWSYATCQRRIDQWLYLDEIYSNKLEKQALLSILPIKEKGGGVKCQDVMEQGQEVVQKDQEMEEVKVKEERLDKE